MYFYILNLFLGRMFSSFGYLFKINSSPTLFLLTVFFLTSEIPLQISKKLNMAVSPTAVHYPVIVNIIAAFCTLNIHIIYIIDGK